MSELVIYTPDGRPIGPEVIDQADLFRFARAMVSPGALGAWWDSYPTESLPHGGRSPESPEEAEQFMRYTRSEAIKAGLWKPL